MLPSLLQKAEEQIWRQRMFPKTLPRTVVSSPLAPRPNKNHQSRARNEMLLSRVGNRAELPEPLYYLLTMSACHRHSYLSDE